MNNFDFPSFLAQIFHTLPLASYPDWSWTCRALRALAIQIAASTQIDLDTVNKRAGRWLVRHGAKYEHKSYTIIRKRYLSILATSPVLWGNWPHRSAVLEPTPVTWFAYKQLGIECPDPIDPVSESVLSQYFALEPSVYFMFWNHRKIEPYVYTWPPETLLCLFRHIKHGDHAQLFIDLLESKVSREQIIAVGLEQGGWLLEFTWSRYQHPILPSDIQNVLHTELIWLLNNDANDSLVAAALSGGYSKRTFIGTLFAIPDYVRRVLAIPGTIIPLPTLRKLLQRTLPGPVFATLREMFGDDTLLSLRAELFQCAMYNSLSDSRRGKAPPIGTMFSNGSSFPPESLDYDSLTPVAALQALRETPALPIDNTYVQKLLAIASQKRTTDDTSSSKAKRRKRSMD
jgi:hypothetical protein